MCNKIIFCYCCILLIFCIKISLSAHGDEYPEDLECITIPENPKHLDDQWEKYKVRNNKTYVGKLEAKRKTDWVENCNYIYRHNLEAKSGKHNYTLRLNHLADMNLGTYHKQMIRLIQSIREDTDASEIVGAPHVQIPEELDWRNKGFITPAENQRDCGSCYAFSVAYMLEAQLLKKTNNLSHLSAQQLVDCSSTSGNYGCNGGSLRNTLKYVDSAGGIVTADEYPYVAKAGTCRYSISDSVLNITKWAILPAKDEHQLERTLATVGPVAVSINASPRTFQLYHSGVYDDDDCSSTSVNHAMIVVGYTKNAWILKNWWGSSWGEKGYMRLKRHRNRCGIANYVAYATID